MTGMGMATASVGGTVSSGPLTASVFITGVGSNISVSGASGNFYVFTGGSGLIFIGASGGTPPYGGSGLHFFNDGSIGSGSCSMGTSADGIHQTIFWSGMAVGDICTFHLTNNVTDSAGGNVTARYPSSSSVTITRSS